MGQDESYHSTISLKTRVLNSGRRVFMFSHFEKWLSKRTYNKEVSSFWCKLIPPEYLYKKPTKRKIKVNGVILDLDISNVVDHGMFWGYQDKAFSFFLSKLQKQFTVIDVGANIGILSTQAAAKCRQVISIEPGKANFDCLSRNVMENNFENVILLNIGLGDKSSAKKLYNIVESNPGMNRIIDDDLDIPYEEIQIARLDEVVSDLKLIIIDIIKIDTEGYEMNVLKGAHQTLTMIKPMIMLEVDDNLLKKQLSSSIELLKFIRSKGYSILNISTNEIIDNFDIKLPPHFDVWCAPTNT